MYALKKNGHTRYEVMSIFLLIVRGADTMKSLLFSSVALGMEIVSAPHSSFGLFALRAHDTFSSRRRL